MHAAYECHEKFTPDGKRLVERERAFGPSLVVGIVVIVAMLTGHDALSALLVPFSQLPTNVRRAGTAVASLLHIGGFAEKH